MNVKMFSFSPCLMLLRLFSGFSRFRCILNRSININASQECQIRLFVVDDTIRGQHRPYIKEINGVYIIGNNQSNYYRNGLRNWSLLGKYLFIPGVIQGCPISEIGIFAFYACLNIEEIFISDSIRQINTYGFSSLESLRRISIPPSVEFIGYAAIHCFNNTLASTVPGLPNTEYTSKGTLYVSFSQNSQIKFMSNGSITRIENIVIYY